MRPEVAVVGAGVIGLTTGIRLAERGVGVHVYASVAPPSTTSAAAGAIWDPIYAQHPSVPLWATRTHDELLGMIADHVPGVRLVEGTEASRRPLVIPGASRRLPEFRECRTEDLPDGFATGWRYRAPIIDMPPYLEYLQDRLLRANGVIEYRTLRSLDEGLADAGIVVNCSGMGSRELVPDPQMRAVRGQLVAVSNPGVSEFFIEHNDGLSESTYFLPQGDLLLLGGSAEPDVSDVVPDLSVAAAIVARCAAIEPVIAIAEVRGHRVGIRPYRPQIRLERVTVGERHIVHNYGHSGSGVSLSWGCADDVADMVASLLA